MLDFEDIYDAEAWTYLVSPAADLLSDVKQVFFSVFPYYKRRIIFIL